MSDAHCFVLLTAVSLLGVSANLVLEKREAELGKVFIVLRQGNVLL